MLIQKMSLVANKCDQQSMLVSGFLNTLFNLQFVKYICYYLSGVAEGTFVYRGRNWTGTTVNIQHRWSINLTLYNIDDQ